MTRKNIVVNPSFENDVLFWATGGGVGSTKVQDATQFLFGTKSMLVSATAADDRVWAQFSDSGLSIEVGRKYIFSAYMRGSGTQRLWVYDGSVDQFSSNITLDSTWTRYSLVVTCAGSGMLAGFRTPNTEVVACYVDGCLWEVTDTLRDYFDGSFANASWSGTANASYSIENSKAFRINTLRPRVFAPGLAR